MKNFTIYWQRHGVHVGDQLTGDGISRVMSEALKVIGRNRVHFAIASDKNRSLKTLQSAMVATGNEDRMCDMATESMFGYNFISHFMEEAWPREDFLMAMNQRGYSGYSTDLAYALKIWPPARICRAIYLAALELWVGRVLKLPEIAKVEKPVVYIAGHSSASYCAPDKTSVPGLIEHGGIVRYEIVLRPEFKIVSAEHATAKQG